MNDSKFTVYSMLFAIVLSMQGCGGSGGSSDNSTDTSDQTTNNDTVDNTSDVYAGSEEPAVIDENNAKELAETAVSGVIYVVEENSYALPMQSAGKSLTTTASVNIMGTADASAEICIHGGEATVEYDDDTGHIHTAHLTNCSYGQGIHTYTFTGVIYHYIYGDGPLSPFTLIHDGLMTYSDGVTRDIYRVYGCGGQLEGCEYYSDYLGSDDRAYRVTDAEVSEDGNSAYIASGRIYDPTYGYIEVTTEVPFTLECPNERPGSGRLRFAGDGQSYGIIEFVSCNEYVITTSSGTSNSYTW
ncbi:MAG: hypothetical protein ABW092_13105 [Candidatus Thiodiazotropha sp.]